MPKINVAIIAPTPYLEEFSSLGDCDMLLAHEGVKNEAYREYFKKRKEEGKFVLMDNGAFEGERILGQELVDLVKEVNPSCVIMPDILGDYEQTKKDTMDFYVEYGTQVRDLDVDLMAVPQGETFEKFIDNYRLFSSLEEVDYIGISYIQFWDYVPGYKEEMEEKEKTLPQSKYRAYKRYMLIKYLEENGIIHRGKKHHLLGLADPYEYTLYERDLEDPSFIFSGDSALAYIMGKKKRLIDRKIGMVGEREKSLEDFNEKPKLDETQIDTIKANIAIIKHFGLLEADMGWKRLRRNTFIAMTSSLYLISTISILLIDHRSSFLPLLGLIISGGAFLAILISYKQAK